ncbi:hypothetical protein AYI68_g1370 [Smittium mucronatum]|uniref:Uncharacterized protein n=1 Tax=Smittium mucronatum TaxID=133383 RepID=A0A1R0H5V3_9FUNG|nr:hypothetical protein AYI68_g1370 [Smittium mucronatum]
MEFFFETVVWYFSLTTPIYTLPVSPFIENTKFLYSTRGKNNRQEPRPGKYEEETLSLFIATSRQELTSGENP